MEEIKTQETVEEPVGLSNGKSENSETINNNSDQPISNEVFTESKVKQLTLNDSFNSSATLGSPSRQQLIGNVINEVINDHINGDHPVPRMVLDNAEDEKNEVSVHQIPSEKTLNGVENTRNKDTLIESDKTIESANSAVTANTENTKPDDNSTVGNLLNEIVDQASNSVEPKTTTIETATLLKDNESGDTDKVGETTSSGTADTRKVDSVTENVTNGHTETDVDESFTVIEVKSAASGEESVSKGELESVTNIETSGEAVNSVDIDKKDNITDFNTSASNGQIQSDIPVVSNKDVEIPAANDIPKVDETIDESNSDSTKGDGGESNNTVAEVASQNTNDQTQSESNNTKFSNDTHGIGEVSDKPDDNKEDLEADKKKDEVEEITQEKKTDEWLDILGNGLLKKKVLKEGLGRDSRPVQGDTVNVRCEGRLDDGTIVDTHNQLQMVLGDADVIQALDMCIALMEDKEICTLTTDARYAYSIYGRTDYKPPIPPNSHLTYELEILSVVRGKSLQELASEECILQSDKKRARGNDLYSRGDYAGAIDAYKRGLKYIEGRREKELLDMKVKCLNNLSAAQLKVKAYTMALQSLEVVLALEPENVKAIFRKGKCLEGLGKESDALDCMKKASLLDPDNKLIVQDLGRLKSRVAVTQQKEKEIYRRMFRQNKTENEKEDAENEESDNSFLIYIGSAMVAAVGLIAGLVWYKHR